MVALYSEDYQELIASIYDCALCPALWERTLEVIATVFGCNRAILSLNDIRHGQPIIEESYGWSEAELEMRAKHGREIRDRLIEWFEANPAEGLTQGKAYVASRELDTDYMAKSQYVQTCLAPLGVIDVMHLFLIRTPTTYSEIVLMRSAGSVPITDRDLDLCAVLLPHLRRAVTISHLLDASEVERTQFSYALNALGHGVVLVAGDGTILHANRVALQMFFRRNPVRNEQNILRAATVGADLELHRALSAIRSGDNSNGPGHTRILVTGERLKPSTLQVLPMTGSSLRSSIMPQAVATVFISREPDAEGLAATLASTYGLTPAETRTLLGLLKGQSLQEAATSAGIAVTTARTHLDNIFGKTGVSRQQELLLLAMRYV